ncbi:MAG: hypothetical protein KKD38_06345 [Candidatus Delongbacteria bacterium]|nr:hypothetical protein [Candidatus Delongbacteria bacterium]
MIKEFGIDPGGFLIPEKRLKTIWSNIDPEGDLSELYEIKKYILDNTEKSDYVFVQGEHGATYNIVDFCFRHKRIPIHATTLRCSLEVKNQNNETIKTSLFKVVKHREYKKDE